MSNLWDGVRFKLDMAQFYLGEMQEDLVPSSARENTSHFIYFRGASTLPPANRWAPKFYYHLDALLAAARSVDFVITTTFGVDKELGRWISTLSSSEQKNRKTFQFRYDAIAKDFRDHRLTRIRNISIHRTGMPPVEVSVIGQWGTHYRGSPNKSLPTFDEPQRSSHPDPDHPNNWMQPMRFAIEPRHDDFVFQEALPDGSFQSQPLFPNCHDYLRIAGWLIEEATGLYNTVHGTQPVTRPPL